MAISNHRLSDEEYARNFSDIHPPFETRDAALVDANRCLFCYDAPCTKSCPTGIDVPKFIKQISTDNLKGSAHTIFQSNIMGGGCSRVCPVEKLCEGACVYNLMEEAPIPIAKLQRYATEKAIRDKWPLFQRAQPTGKKVAVVGAGPSGLSCAHVLARSGADVTIFEKEEKGGGLMTYGIAAYKVTPAFCEEELEYILSIGGITVLYGQELGRNISLAGLQQQYDAVYLAFGVGLARQLEIPGEELTGVVDAISFIYDLRSKGYPEVEVGDKVAVIGLGMTAIDAATQARRLGAKEVTIVYRRTQDEMPCTQAELDIAKLDGCRILWLAAPKAIIGAPSRTTDVDNAAGSGAGMGAATSLRASADSQHVTGLVCSVMQLGAPDSSGRRSPIDTGETITLEVDMIIKAAGQTPFMQLVEDTGLANDKGKIVVGNGGVTNGVSMSGAPANYAGVFAGGDCVNGGKEVVDAVQAGKDAAAAILDYLSSRANADKA